MSLMIYRKSTVEVLEQSGTLSKIRDDNDNEFTVKTNSLKPVPASRVPRSLTVLSPHDSEVAEFDRFIDYLRTPEAQTSLHLEAQCPEMDFAVRQQYRKLTCGAELKEGEGYHVAPSRSNKTGCEGCVTFVMPPFELPTPIKSLMVQRPGFINRIGFVWLLIEQGFYCTR
jgi:hypothetical protein